MGVAAAVAFLAARAADLVADDVDPVVVEDADPVVVEDADPVVVEDADPGEIVVVVVCVVGDKVVVFMQLAPDTPTMSLS